MNGSIEDQIDRLNDEKKGEYEERIESKRNQIKRELKSGYRDKIENQIEDDIEELQDFNIIISAFLEKDETDYDFIRTEPLYHEGEKNFDVLIASRDAGITIFIECERSLVSGLPRRLTEFFEQIEIIESNSPDDLDVNNYLSRVVGREPEHNEFVLASKQVSDERLTNEAEERNKSFIAWQLTPSGNRCKIRYHIARKGETAPLDGHYDEDLMRYIEDFLQPGIPYIGHIDFTYSTSRYLKIKNMIVAIMNRIQRKDLDYFGYDVWEDLFDVELSNYRDKEKKVLFRNFIEYGKKCGIISLEEDLGDVLDNRYRIVSRATKNQEKLVTDIFNKMSEYEMKTELEHVLKEEKEKILAELQRDQATGGYTLFDFPINNEKE